MKHTLLLYLLIPVVLWPAFSKAQPFCGFDSLHAQRMITNPAYRQSVRSFELKLRQSLRVYSSNSVDSVFTDSIPVVFHIIHTGGEPGSTFNPSDAQVQRLIDYTNQLYAGTLPGEAGAGDIGIRFVLARRDPNCNPTNGIDRTDGRIFPLYEKDGLSFEGDETAGVSTDQLMDLIKWDPYRYYNIWVVNSINTHTSRKELTGFTFFPLQSAEDGVFMTSASVDAYEITLPHELGHAFFLYHTFQGSDGNTCPANEDCNTNGDQVCDTDPITVDYSEGRTGVNPCTGYSYSDNTEKNYMSYTCCQNNLFTEGQKERMQQTAVLNPLRDTLRSSPGRLAPDPSGNCGYPYLLDGHILPTHDVLLSWKPDGQPGDYELQRSYNAVNFESIAVIPGSAVTSGYSFTDRSIVQILQYYRLRRPAGNNFYYSNTVTISLPVDSSQFLRLLGNPVRDNIDLELGFIPNGGGVSPQIYQADAIIRLTDIQGRQVASLQQTVHFYQRIRIDASRLPAGIYILHVEINHRDFFRKILKRY
jgi:hypothetical protein